MLPLTACPIGQSLIVVRVAARKNLCRRLEALGAVKGAPLEIFSETCGNLLLKVGGTKVGINRELAACVFCRPA